MSRQKPGFFAKPGFLLHYGCQRGGQDIDTEFIQNVWPETDEQADQAEAETTHHDDDHDGDEPGIALLGWRRRRSDGYAGDLGHGLVTRSVQEGDGQADAQ